MFTAKGQFKTKWNKNQGSNHEKKTITSSTRRQFTCCARTVNKGLCNNYQEGGGG